MAKSKTKTGTMLDAYSTSWTDEQRENWKAVGAFICRLRREGKIGQGRA